MSGPRPLRDIADELLTFEGGDNEVEHQLADVMLIEAIERLSAYATETVDEGESERLIEAFNRLVKWYA